MEQFVHPTTILNFPRIKLKNILLSLLISAPLLASGAVPENTFEVKNLRRSVLADTNEGSQIRATFHLWKRGNEKFTDKELSPVKSIRIQKDNSVLVLFEDGTTKTAVF